MYYLVGTISFMSAFVLVCVFNSCTAECPHLATDAAISNAADAPTPPDITIAIDNDGDGVFPPEDCNDHDPNVYPGAYEYCDFQDNDCDGETDETWKSLWGGLYGTPCSVTDTNGCVSVGRWGCDMDHDWLACNASPVVAHVEKCNGADDDCDGVTDNGQGWPMIGTVCTIMAGTCTVPGLWACSSYTEMPYCTAEDIPFPETTCLEN